MKKKRRRGGPANAWQGSFANQLGFVAATPAPTSFTTDRGEFIGRNGSPKHPAALHRVGLSGRHDPLADPCAAVRVEWELTSGEEREVTFIAGLSCLILAELRQLVSKV